MLYKSGEYKKGLPFFKRDYYYEEIANLYEIGDDGINYCLFARARNEDKIFNLRKLFNKIKVFTGSKNRLYIADNLILNDEIELLKDYIEFLENILNVM